MSDPAILILCGGANTRWGGYRDTRRKHLVTVEGEVLLARTLRQLAAAGHGPGAIQVVVNAADAPSYEPHVAGSACLHHLPPADIEATPADKFLSSRGLWNHAGPTVVLLGDVWFEDDALAAVLAPRDEPWLAFGRSGGSALTGCPHGELFAQRFTRHEEHERCLLQLDAQYRAGTCVRAASGWAHYQLMTGGDPNLHTPGPCLVELGSFTEDFDAPADLECWLQGRAAHGSASPPRAAALPRAGRNDPCPCGSGRKFKRCCAA